MYGYKDVQESTSGSYCWYVGMSPTQKLLEQIEQSVNLLAREAIYLLIHLFKKYKHTRKEHFYYVSDRGQAISSPVVKIDMVPALMEDK